MSWAPAPAYALADWPDSDSPITAHLRVRPGRASGSTHVSWTTQPQWLKVTPTRASHSPRFSESSLLRLENSTPFLAGLAKTRLAWNGRRWSS